MTALNSSLPAFKRCPVTIRKSDRSGPKVAAVDFDGVINVKRHYAPLAEAELRDGVIDMLKTLRAAGVRVVIWTARSDADGVAAWCREHGVPFDEVNNNTGMETGSRKIVADAYLDDRAVNAGADRDMESILKKAVDVIFGEPRQPVDEGAGYEDLKALAEGAAPELAAILSTLGMPVIDLASLDLGELEKSIYEAEGGLILTAPIKEEARATEKVDADYDGDWSRLLDMLRAAVVVDTVQEVKTAMEKVGEAGGALARLPKDRFAEPLSNGYRDMLCNYKLPSGFICEVQYHLKAMIVAREKQRMAQDLVRAIKASMKEEGREDMTPAEAEACRRAKDQTRHLFAQAWRQATGEGEAMEKGIGPRDRARIRSGRYAGRTGGVVTVTPTGLAYVYLDTQGITVGVPADDLEKLRPVGSYEPKSKGTTGWTEAQRAAENFVKFARKLGCRVEDPRDDRNGNITVRILDDNDKLVSLIARGDVLGTTFQSADQFGWRYFHGKALRLDSEIGKCRATGKGETVLDAAPKYAVRPQLQSAIGGIK